MVIQIKAMNEVDGQGGGSFEGRGKSGSESLSLSLSLSLSRINDSGAGTGISRVTWVVLKGRAHTPHTQSTGVA